MPAAIHTSLSKQPRPPSYRSVFLDGPPDASFRAGNDISLSHWLGHPAPAPWRADTAVEVALKFLRADDPDWDLVVNGHVDVDGILATWILLHPESAPHHGPAMVGAAHMADHWGWAEGLSQILFLGTTLKMNSLVEQQVDPAEVYRQCVDHVSRLLGGMGRDDAPVREAQRILAAGVQLVESGRIERRLPSERFATYVIPRAVHGDDLQRALHVPSFNGFVTDRCLLWPQVRSRFDRERVNLVSVESPVGWFHDLWYPGYAWADTPTSWRPPGIRPGTDPNHCILDHAPLNHAVEELQSCEQNAVTWMAPAKLFPFSRSGKVGRKFPVVLACVNDDGLISPSSMSPQQVSALLAPLFQLG